MNHQCFERSIRTSFVFRSILRLSRLSLFVLGLWTSLSENVSAQSLPSRVSGIGDVYVWTDDLASSYEALLDHVDLSRSDFERLCLDQFQAILRDEEIEQTSVDDLKNIFEALGGDVFPKGCVVSYSDHSQMHRTLIVSAPTNADFNGVKLFFDSVERLAATVKNPKWKRTENRAQDRAFELRQTETAEGSNDELTRNADKNLEVELHALDNELGFWALHDEVVHWSNDESALKQELAVILNSDERLRDDRAFQFFTETIPNGKRGELNLFVTPIGLPKLVDRYTYDVFQHLFWSESWNEVWEIAELNELRGFGARFRFASTQLTKESQASLTWDSLLIMTNPRQGVLSALKNQQGLSYRIPTGTGSIERFIEVQLDGDTLAIELARFRKSFKENFTAEEQDDIYSPYVFGWHNGYNADEEVLKDLYESVIGIGLFVMKSREQDGQSFNHNVGWRVDSSLETTRAFAGALVQTEATQLGVGGDGNRITVDEFDRGLQFRVSQRAIEATVEERKKYVEFYEKDYAKRRTERMAKEEGREPTGEELEQARAEGRAAHDRLLNAWLTRWREDRWLVIDEWYMNHTVGGAYLDETLNQTEPLPEVVELRRIVDSIVSERKLSDPLGVYSVWNHTPPKRAEYPAPKLPPKPLSYIGQYYPSPTWIHPVFKRELDYLRDALIYSVSSNVIVLTNERRGFRMTGALIKR